MSRESGLENYFILNCTGTNCFRFLGDNNKVEREEIGSDHLSSGLTDGKRNPRSEVSRMFGAHSEGS